MAARPEPVGPGPVGPEPPVRDPNGRTEEIELKYRVDDLDRAEELLAVERIGPYTATGGRVRAVQMEDRYVDTRDGALERAGFAVRIRQSGAGTIVSVKSLHHGDGPGGAVRREELEGPADRVGAAVDWPASDARALVMEHAGDAPLLELVTIRQLRRKRILKAPDSRIEISLDEIDVVARGRVIERFVEIEAEVLKGDDGGLAAIAEVFDAIPTLRRSTVSKFEAAMTAVRGDDQPRQPKRSKDRSREREHRAIPSTPIDAQAVAIDVASVDVPVVDLPTIETAPPIEPVSPDETSRVGDDDGLGSESSRLNVGRSPGVSADDHVAEAGRKVLRFHLARMLDFEAGTRSGEDPEDLHKMRVATRRQRAAWRVFGSAFRAGRTRRYRTGLREVAGRLGAVRDLDVQLEAADRYRADLPVAEQRAIEPLLASWQAHRDDARILLLRELDSDGYRRWIDDYRDFVRTEGALVLPVGPVEPHRVRDTAPSRIWTAYEGVRGYESVLRWADVETLHDLRIAAKGLRYSLEFVREALGPGATPLIARVTTLQDHLGLMNDASVTASMARTFLVERSGDLSSQESAAIGRYLVDREREVARCRRTIGAPWRGVAGTTFRRGLGRVVASL